ncbi:hypothetical protein V8C40DRAFT_257130 [Trichoderma camerunense]
MIIIRPCCTYWWTLICQSVYKVMLYYPILRSMSFGHPWSRRFLSAWSFHSPICFTAIWRIGRDKNKQINTHPLLRTIVFFFSCPSLIPISRSSLYSTSFSIFLFSDRVPCLLISPSYSLAAVY